LYWDELSSGSRRPADAAANINAGRKAFGDSTTKFVDAAHALESGTMFPELILLRGGTTGHLVVLEGHLRLTAYLLAPVHIPDDLEVILGESPKIMDWHRY
jgi:hypothetical protein